MTDITSRVDIELLMDEFYSKVLQDEAIGFIFTDVAKLNLEKHLPIICDFWESILFQTHRYKGNVLVIHESLNQQIKLKKEHFDRWLSIFQKTVDESFRGTNAEMIKIRAHSIATVMQIKLAAF